MRKKFEAPPLEPQGCWTPEECRGRAYCICAAPFSSAVFSETMVSAADWRYDNLKHLKGAKFRFATYKSPVDYWNHDHCRGCWATFAEFTRPDILHEGYVFRKPHQSTPEPESVMGSKERGLRCIPQPVIEGCTLHWICSSCFDEFRELLRFGLDTDDIGI